MPLKPVDRLTGKPKLLAEFTPSEQAHWAQQVIDEQRINAQTGRGIDEVALKQAETFAKGNQPLLDRIADARVTIAKGPQPVTQPSPASLGARK